MALAAWPLINPDGPQGLRLVRPLLGLPKARLAADLKRRGVAWAEDPSNENTGFKRVRLRTVLQQLDEEGLDARRICETARRLRRAADAIDTWVDRIWLESVDQHPAGPVRINYPVFIDLPEEVRLRLLSGLVLRASGRVTPLRLSKLEHAESALFEAECQLTLAGAVLLRRKDWLFVWREVGRAPPPTMPLQTAGRFWDGRFAIELSGCAPTIIDAETNLGPLISAPGPMKQIDLPPVWPGAAFEAVPALWRGEALLFAAGLFQAPEMPGTGFPDIRLIPR
jgi:tRNA(Ile)-lysidine synthase